MYMQNLGIKISERSKSHLEESGKTIIVLNIFTFIVRQNRCNSESSIRISKSKAIFDREEVSLINENILINFDNDILVELIRSSHLSFRSQTNR